MQLSSIALTIIGVVIIGMVAYVVIRRSQNGPSIPDPFGKADSTVFTISRKLPNAMIAEVQQKLEQDPNSEEPIYVRLFEFDPPIEDPEARAVQAQWYWSGSMSDHPQGLDSFVRSSYNDVILELKNAKRRVYDIAQHANDLVTQFLQATPLSRTVSQAVGDMSLAAHTPLLALDNTLDDSGSMRAYIIPEMRSHDESFLPKPSLRSEKIRLGFFPGHIQLHEAKIGYCRRIISFETFRDHELKFHYPVGEAWLDHKCYRPFPVARIQDDVLDAIEPFADAGISQQIYRAAGLLNIELRRSDKHIILISDRSAFLQCGVVFDDVASGTLVDHLKSFVNLPEDEPSGFVELLFDDHVVHWFYSTQNSFVQHREAIQAETN